MKDNTQIQIERKGAGVVSFLTVDGERDAYDTPREFKSLAAAVGFFEKIAAARYMRLTWDAKDSFTATGRYI